jgi:2-(1,2-epoxy-1,2-dihydrophenyl)acetyl-CoA isomerase
VKRAGFVTYRESDHAAWITLADGANGNPVHPEMVSELSDAARRAREQSASVIVLSAEGKYFSIGGDIARFAHADDVEAYMGDLVGSLHQFILDLTRSAAVVVSAVQGPAAGGGFPLAAAADVVIAARSASFSLGYSRIGLTVDAGTSLLTQSLGLHRTLRLALLNDRITAEEGMALGLVARVVDDADLVAETAAVVGRLARGPAAAQGSIKALVRGAAHPTPGRVLEQEAAAIARSAASADGREGVRAFLDKRTPNFP